jgi:hypothetical protein
LETISETIKKAFIKQQLPNKIYNLRKMKTLKNCLSVSVLLAVVVLSSGCETMSSAYDSTKESVSGWFGKGEKKAD